MPPSLDSSSVDRAPSAGSAPVRRRKPWNVAFGALRTAVLFLIVFAGLTLLLGWLRAPSLPDAAPLFTLPDVEGGAIELASLRGRPVIVNFWATWCPPCRAEIPALSAFARKHPEIVVLGIAVDGEAAELREARRTMGIDYPILRADDATLGAYAVRSLPTTVIVDPDGRVTAAHAGRIYGPQLWWMTRGLRGALAAETPAAGSPPQTTAATLSSVSAHGG
ncbi:MAG: TlpA disulfide reductase family protein [Acidobacteriota bacterium]